MVKNRQHSEFLEEALELLIEARRAITMTYGVGFFMRLGDVENDLYELQQSMLWDALDTLDHMTDGLEKEEVLFNKIVEIIQDTQVLGNNFEKFRLQVVTTAAGVKEACNKLLKYIQDDLQNKKFEGSVSKAPRKFIQQYWSCLACSFENTEKDKACQMCEIPRGEGKR